jgi:hypothetical protein
MQPSAGSCMVALLIRDGRPPSRASGISSETGREKSKMGGKMGGSSERRRSPRFGGFTCDGILDAPCVEEVLREKR